MSAPLGPHGDHLDHEDEPVHDDESDAEYRTRGDASWPTDAEILDDPTIEDVAVLARRHDKEAIDTLAALLKCRGRQAMVAAVSATALVKIGHPDMTKEKIEALVEERLKALIAEAQQRKQLPAPVSPR